MELEELTEGNRILQRFTFPDPDGALPAIMLNVSPEIKSVIAGLGTCDKMWGHLMNEYQGVNQNKKQAGIRDLAAFQCLDPSMKANILAMEVLIRDTTAANGSDLIRIQDIGLSMLISALPEGFSALQAVLDSTKDLTFERAKDQIIQFESSLKNRNVNQALAVGPPKSARLCQHNQDPRKCWTCDPMKHPRNRICTSCGQKGHKSNQSRFCKQNQQQRPVATPEFAEKALAALEPVFDEHVWSSYNQDSLNQERVFYQDQLIKSLNMPPKEPKDEQLLAMQQLIIQQSQIIEKLTKSTITESMPQAKRDKLKRDTTVLNFMGWAKAMESDMKSNNLCDSAGKLDHSAVTFIQSWCSNEVSALLPLSNDANEVWSFLKTTFGAYDLPKLKQHLKAVKMTGIDFRVYWEKHLEQLAIFRAAGGTISEEDRLDLVLESINGPFYQSVIREIRAFMRKQESISAGTAEEARQMLQDFYDDTPLEVPQAGIQ
ncbi:hypothetical protein EDD86DRAFT_249910 [Gorgonomyces haynaldii]|nr:hypothetical protein EDD86DRAFT_249910 [Gorgonomyces haynaldii]